MKRPSYFQQVAPAAPARRRAGAAVLTPAPLLFRPGAADIGFQEAEASTAARPAARAASTEPRQPRAQRLEPEASRTAAEPKAARPAPATPPAAASDAGLRILERLTQTRPGPSAPPPRREAQPLAPVAPRHDHPAPVEARMARPAPEAAAFAPAPARETAALPRLQPRPAGPLPLITPAAQPPRPAPAREPPASGLHIGTLEVRVTAPAPAAGQPQPAPRMVARGAARRPSGGRIARGFGVFGLGQS